jgi:hypothetical protein
VALLYPGRPFSVLDTVATDRPVLREMSNRVGIVKKPLNWIRNVIIHHEERIVKIIFSIIVMEEFAVSGH